MNDTAITLRHITNKALTSRVFERKFKASVQKGRQGDRKRACKFLDRRIRSEESPARESS